MVGGGGGIERKGEKVRENESSLLCVVVVRSVVFIYFLV